MFRNTCCALFLFLCLAGHTQNFIPNYSFENYAVCPQSRNDGRRSYNWDTPTEGTSDYFNTCATPQSQLDVPSNFAGKQDPRTGNAYAGFYASQDFQQPRLEYREYMQVTMDSFLVAGGVYTFEMYVSLGDNSNYASNKIGAYISAAKISANTDEYLNYRPQILSSTYITDKTGWTKITGTYVATGGEHYVTIGVFEPASTATRITVPAGSNSGAFEGVSYYYLDDVSMTRACDLPKVLLPDDFNVCDDKFSPVSITALPPNANSYLWNTGATTATLQVNNPGKYTLKASTVYCTVYDTINVNFTSKPKVDLGKDTTLCIGAVRLNATSGGASYKWNTGSTDSVITVFTSGTYIVQVSVPLCSVWDTIVVKIANIQPFSLGPDITLCSGSKIALKITGNPLTNYRWSTGETSAQINVSNAGTYIAEAYVGLCNMKDTVKITVEQPPVINLGNDTALCLNKPFEIKASQALNYLWNDSSTHSSLFAYKSGLYWVEVKGIKCAARDSLVITQKPWPFVDLGPNQKVCRETMVELNAGSQGTSYTWNDQAATTVRKVNAPGTFSVVVTNKDGCYSGDTIVLDIFPPPIVNLGRDSFVCEGRTYTLDAGDFESYLWQDGSITRHFEPATAGTYYVRVTDKNTCLGSDTVRLLYYEKPDVKLIKQLRICEPDTLITAYSSTNNYTWNDGTATASNRVTDYGTYTVTVTDVHFCTNTASLEVTSNCPGNLYVPNAFTPTNNDGVNETFIPVLRNIKSMHLYIYTRWGELVFETEDEHKGWDGTYRNQPAQADVYVYKVDYVAANGVAKTVGGNVTLLK